MIEKSYAGIGSRGTFPDVIAQMVDIGRAASGVFVLHSGGADGADLAFEQGCNEGGGKKKIFLPWTGFNNSISPYHEPPAQAFKMAEEIHPAWHACSLGAKKLHARNIQQVLGESLNTPVSFVVCWTEDGKAIGGTATAINLARKNRIPVFNLFNPGEYDRVIALIEDEKQSVQNSRPASP